MGYYDDFGYKPRSKRGASWFISMVIAAVIGSTTTMVASPILIEKNESKGTSPVFQNNVQPIQTSVPTINTDVTKAVNSVRPAVVTVVNLQSGTSFGNNGAREAGKGSGVIIDKKGHIVTNYHVIKGATEVEVLVNQEQVKAQVLGADEFTDLAVLKVSSDAIKDIEPVTLGSSENLQIGEPAIAIGNPLGEFDQTVTVGVISAKQRNLPITDQMGNVIYEQTVLQTDAAINPGNSGGALINIEGKLIGINSAKISSSGIEGLGFAIPVDEVKPIIEQLINKGKVTRPALGVSVSYEVKQLPNQIKQTLPVDYGVVVENVMGAAEAAGLKSGDIITSIDDTKIDSFLDLRKYLFTKQEGDRVNVSFYRDTELKSTTITLQKLKD